MKKTFLILTALLIGLSFLVPSVPAKAQSTPPTENEIADFLNGLPQIADSGGRVLSVTYFGEALVIDLSREVLPESVYDEALFTNLQSELDAAFQINLYFMVTFKVEGLPLEDWGRPVLEITETAEWPLDRDLPADGPLAGYKIALGAGHGIYWNESLAEWRYQRLEFWGIREDIVNSEIIQLLKARLESLGATVIDTREMDQNARTGVSGYPAWHEAARRFAIYLGLPSSIWDSRDTNYNSDIRTRPYMANYYDADILVNLHNNGYNGEFRGTETYWDSNNDPGSQALATAVHNQIISTLRAAYGTWTNRGIKVVDDAYGEINFAEMPAILVELAFMDNYEDNAMLQLDSFKEHSANAMAAGICEYLGADCDPAPVTLEFPSLAPSYAGMCDSGWSRYKNDRGVYAYLTLNAEEEAQSANLASWSPVLPNSGEYNLEVYIPAHAPVNWSCPSQTVDWDTNYAAYTISHANGTSTVLVNQAVLNDEWVSLGNFHFNADTDVSITLSDVTGEEYLTTTVSASAARFTLVGNAGQQFYDTDFVPANWAQDESGATTEEIRNFLIFNQSCLADPIQDSGGETIDIADLLQQAAAANQISAKLLLAIMEAEQSAISTCPDDIALANLMGLTASTARQQISEAAIQLGNALSTLTITGASPNGWATGSPKTTFDGVSIIPANDTITLLFDYFQNAGQVWGGATPDENGVWGAYIAYRDYLLYAPLPKAIETRYLSIFFR